jgi:hypothetical protein
MDVKHVDVSDKEDTLMRKCCSLNTSVATTLDYIESCPPNTRITSKTILQEGARKHLIFAPKIASQTISVMLQFCIIRVDGREYVLNPPQQWRPKLGDNLESISRLPEKPYNSQVHAAITQYGRGKTPPCVYGRQHLNTEYIRNETNDDTLSESDSMDSPRVSE